MPSINLVKPDTVPVPGNTASQGPGGNALPFYNPDGTPRAFQTRLAGEYAASLERLLPLKARLAATDRLIDRVVYRLYGLTEEEVALVEGGAANKSK